MIKQYFANYYLHEADISVNMKDGSVTMLKSEPERWTVTLVETGLSTMTGGYLLQLRQYLGDDSSICATARQYSRRGPLKKLARDNEVMSYPHNGFWYSMDTFRDQIHLENLWKTGSAPWMVW